MMAIWRAAAVLGAMTATASAGNYLDLERSCVERANWAHGKHWIEECIEQIATSTPVRPTIATIAPGSGPAFGLGFNHDPFRPRSFEIIPEGRMVASPNRSFLLQGQLTVAFEPFVARRESDESEHQHELRTIGLIRDPLGIDVKASVTVRARRFEATHQDFYGLGATTALSGLASYGLRQNEAGIALNYPLTSWSSVGATADFIQPRIISVPGTATQIGTLYNSSTAPGLNSVNDFLRVEPYLQFRFPCPGGELCRHQGWIRILS